MTRSVHPPPAHAEVDADGRVVIGTGPRRPGLHNVIWRQAGPHWQTTAPPLAAASAGDDTRPAVHGLDTIPPLQTPLPTPPRSWAWPPRKSKRLQWHYAAVLAWAAVATAVAWLK